MVKFVVLASIFCLTALVGWWVFPPSSEPKFNFDAAPLFERQAWLSAQAKPLAKRISLSLPKGNEARPGMKVTAARVNAQKRVIEMDITMDGPVGLRANPMAAMQAFGKQLCPGYTNSVLGENKINVVHNFQDQSKRPILIVTVTPAMCRELMRG